MFGKGCDVTRRCLLLALSLVAASAVHAHTVPEAYFVDTPVSITAQPGQDVTLPCAVHNLGTKTVAWRRNDASVPISVGKFIFDGDDRFQVLTHTEGEMSEFNLKISDVEADFSGTYVCTISTKERLTRNVNLTVIVPEPYFADTPVSITAQPGQDAVLPCAVHNLGTKMVSWRRNDSRYPISVGSYIYESDDRFEVLTHTEGEMSEFNLKISDVEEDFSGTYVCTISTKQRLTRNVNLTVIAHAESTETSFLETPVTVAGQAGQDVILPCAVHNLGFKRVTWRQNDSVYPISVGSFIYDSDDRFEVLTHTEGEMSEFNLKISEVEANFSGTYVCEISAKRLSLTRNVDLTVIESAETSFLETPVTVTGQAGQDVVLPCAVLNQGFKWVIWSRNNSSVPISVDSTVFDDDDKFEIVARKEGEMSEFNLKISDVEADFSGTYVCMISDMHGLSRNVDLTVIDD